MSNDVIPLILSQQDITLLESILQFNSLVLNMCQAGRLVDDATTGITPPISISHLNILSGPSVSHLSASKSR